MPDSAPMTPRQDRLVTPENAGAYLEPILAIWSEVLECQAGQLAADSNFFLHGGDSLHLLRVLNRLRERLGIDLDLQEVATYSTPANMAARCEAVAGKTPHGPRAAPEPRGMRMAGRHEPERFPASAGQAALWLAEQLAGASGVYNTAAVLHLHGDLRVPVLAQALTSLVLRHDMLRCRLRFDTAAKMLFNDFAPVRNVVLEPEPVAPAALAQRLQALAGLPFDLASGPLWRFHLLATGPGAWTLLLCVHHCISDGWSGGVVLRHLAEAYNRLRSNPRWTASASECEYRNFCRQQQRTQTETRWWRQALAGADQLAPWPAATAHRGPFALGHAESLLPEEALTRVQTAVRETGIRFSVFLLAALRLALRELTGLDEFCLGLPVNVRTTTQQENSIGYFVNLLVLRERLAPGAPGFATLLQVQQGLLAALDHRASAFPVLVRELKPAPLPSGNPWCDILFAFQNLPPVRPRFAGLEAALETLAMPCGQYPLKVEIARSGAGWNCRIEFARELLTPAEIHGLRASFEQQLGLLLASVPG